MGGSSQLQNGGLRALGEAWDDFLLEAFFCQVWSFSVLLGSLWVAPVGVDLRSWRSQEVNFDEKEQKPDAQKKVSMKRKCSTSCPG